MTIMSDQFDWRTDDEDWPDEPMIAPVRNSAVFHHCPPWFLIFVLFSLLVLVGSFTYRQIGEHVEVRQEMVEAEILLAQELLFQANAQHDVELLRSLLSGRDVDWTDVQLALVSSGRLFDRTGLGLYSEPDVTNIRVTLAPDFESAELVFEQSYDWQNGQGVTETVRLQQTAVYRRGEKWLYSPPVDEFWGDRKILDGRSLSVTYYQRDSTLVQKLAADLESLIADVCHLPDIDCPSNLFLNLSLVNDPESLLETADAPTLLSHTLPLTLPTPSLVGIPVDDASYQALLQGYSIQLAAAIISQQIAYQCCDPELLHQALLDWHLSQLGLRAWPLTAAYYDERLFWNIHPEDFRRLWYSPPTTREPLDVYVLVQFLASNRTYLSPIASQRLLNQDLTYHNWLTQVAGEDINTALLYFIIEQSNLSAKISPIPLPQADIIAVCNEALRRYEMPTGQLTELTVPDEEARFWDIWPLQEGYLLVAYYFDDPNPIGQTQLFRAEADGRYTSLYDSRKSSLPGETVVFDHALDPSQRYFLMAVQNLEQEHLGWALLDSANCNSHDCQLIALSERPHWSPSGHNTLLRNGADYFKSFPPRFPLYLADAAGQNLVHLADDVTSFAWLDDQTILYIRFDGNEQIVVTRELGSGLEKILVHSRDLPQFVADLPLDDSLQLTTVQVNPQNANMFLVTASSGQTHQFTYYFLVQRQNGEISTKLMPIQPNNFWVYFTPDGRSLVSLRSQFKSAQEALSFTFYDLETGQQSNLTVPSWRLEWSDDNNWIVVVHDLYMVLMAPTYNYAQAIPGDLANCHNLIWVNQ